MSRPVRTLAFAVLIILADSAAADAAALPPIRSGPGNAVPACTTAGRLMAFLAARNPTLNPRFAGIAADYLRVGSELGVRADYAFFQMLLETGNLTFRRGSQPGSVRPEQNNFAGLGASGGGARGESFPDVATGVRAHLQHLLVYAGDRIESPVAMRTRKVQEWNVLTAWQQSLKGPVGFHDLAVKWAPFDRNYSANIESVGRRFYSEHCPRGEQGPAAPVVAAAPLPATAPAPAIDPSRAHATLMLLREGMRPPAPVLAERPTPPAAEARAAAVVAAPPAARPATPAAGDRSVLSGVVPAAVNIPAAASTAPPAAARAAIAGPPAQAVARPPASTPAAAKPPPVNPADEAVRTLVSGQKLELHAALGTIIPITFRPDGSVHGKAGSLASMLGSATDEGRWWVDRGRLCTRWQRWLDRETQCLKLRRVGSIVHWTREDGTSGTARVVSQ